LLLSRSGTFQNTVVPSRKKYISLGSTSTWYLAATCTTSGTEIIANNWRSD